MLSNRACAFAVWLLVGALAVSGRAADEQRPAVAVAPQPVGSGNKEPGPEAWGEVRVTTDRAPAAQFTIAPNGAQIAFFGYHRGYKLYDVATGKVTLEVPSDVSIHDLTYSPDGKTLATAEWFSGVRLRDPKTGTVLETLKPEGDLGAFYATYLRDGKLAAHCWRSDGAGRTMREQLAVWDPTGKELIGWPVTEHSEAKGEMIRRRFAGPGRHLLSIETRTVDGYVVARSATVTNPATNKVSPAVKLDMDDDFVFDASPDGRSLLVFNLNRPPRLVDVGTGRTSHMLKGHRRNASCGAFSPDGKLIATASGTSRRTNLAPGFTPPAGTPTEIILWDSATGRKVAVYRDPTTIHDYTQISFSPDGKFIVAMGAPERPGAKELKGGRMVLWGKLPAPAPLGEAEALRAEIEELRAELARLRSMAAPGRFLDRGAYVEDTKTGLLWQKDGAASGKHNFYDAFKYATNLELGGFPGWRVPTKEELAAIFPATEAPFTNTKYNKNPYSAKGAGEWNNYWTSTVDPRVKDYAFVYHWYAKGGANNCLASQNLAYVRCVHDPIKK
jgi:WD40 repeat protein